MHFALPPRKTSRPPPYVAARQQKPSLLKRIRLRTLALIAGAVCFLLFLLLRATGGEAPTAEVSAAAAHAPRCVLVTVIDNTVNPELQQLIQANRREYASLHGYDVFFGNISEYDVTNPPTPVSWLRIPAMRHAMTVFPHTPFFFYLDQHALIVNATHSIDSHIVEPRRLESLMVVDQPIVLPDSLIRTFRHRRGEHIDVVLTQDREGLSTGSFIVKRGEWAKYLLDAWYDPLYRAYNFQRAERHALEHLVQWHVTVLARLALVPQKIMNSYTKGADDQLYSDGDFVANMFGCDRELGRDACLEEAKPLFDRFQASAQAYSRNVLNSQ